MEALLLVVDTLVMVLAVWWSARNDKAARTAGLFRYDDETGR